MYKQIIKKIKNKKWLTLCLVLGLSFLVATLSCQPMFEKGSLDRLINNLFVDYVQHNNEFPSIIGRTAECSIEEYTSLSTIMEEIKDYRKSWDESLDIPVVETQTNVYFHDTKSASTYGVKKRYYYVSYMPDILAHTQIVAGQDFDSYQGDGVPCIISESVMDEYGLVVGETIDFIEWIDKDSKSLKLVVSGVFKEKESNDYFWYKQPNKMVNQIYVSEQTFDHIMKNYNASYVYYEHYSLYDYRVIDHSNIEKINRALRKIIDTDKDVFQTLSVIFDEYQKGRKTIEITLWVLEIPILGMVLAYIYMVACQIIETEKNEIAMLKSRGISRIQVISMYVLQSVILSLGGLLFGIPLGYLLCKVGAATTDFLSFSLEGLSLYKFTGEMFLYALVAVMIGVIFILIPVITSSKISIVQMKGADSVNKKMVWEKFFFDFIMLGGSIYLLYNFNKNIADIRNNALTGEKMDPTIFMDSVLFIVALGLVILRLTHHLVKLVYKLGQKKWSPAMYASFLQITRTTGKQGFISVFLILTVALGLFNANIARTINKNNIERIRYNNGADMNICEEWKKKIYTSDPIDYEFIEPDYAKYDKLIKEGLCESMTRVIYDENVLLEGGSGKVENCMFQGVSTKEFGETAYLRDEFNKKQHWYEHLNQLAVKPNGVIISKNLAEKLKLEVGNTVEVTRFGAISILKDEPRGTLRATVCAIVDAWPGYNRYYYENGKLQERYLVVTNYSTAFSVFKLSPYNIWLKLADGVTAQQVEEVVNQMPITNVECLSVERDVQKMEDSAMIQITNGMFTLSFIIALVLCAVGFMIYWISSIRQRELLFGVYRAMGMTVKEINKMLINEHIFSTLLSVCAGGIVGIVSTILFAKLFGVIYLPERHTIDIFLHCEVQDIIKLAIVIIVMIVACIIVLRKQVKSMNITQALKLGED